MLYTAHGTSKLIAWPVGGHGAVRIGTWPYWWAGLLETVLGVLLLVGLFTRAAAFVASGEMAVAYFWQHQPGALWPLDPANGGEPAVLYCFGFFLLVFAGGGALAIDSMRRDRDGATPAPESAAKRG